MPNNAMSLIGMGSVTSAGVPFTIDVQPLVDYVYVKNRTQWGASANPGVVIQAEWFSRMAADSAYTITNTNSANGMNAGALTSGGFSLIDYSSLPSYTPVALASPFFTQANPVVFTTASPHGLAVGDLVQIYNLTGARQYAGVTYSVSAVGSSTTFSVLLNTVGITVASAGTVKKIAADISFYPGRRIITQASLGATTTLTLQMAHTLTVGQYVRLRVPSGFGTLQLDGLTGKITAVNVGPTVNSITLDINSTGFTAFAWPASSAVPFTFAEVIPIGEVATTLEGATVNQAIQGVRFGSSVCGAASDVLDYWLFRADVYPRSV